jgi:hypothetical protein
LREFQEDQLATNATHQQAAPRVRKANPASDRIFFSLMIVLLWAAVLFGFAKTYFMAGMVSAPLPNKLIHIHGAAFTLWMVFLLVQEGLIAGRKIKWHMQLGLVGFGLAIVMVVLGLLAATDSLRRGVSPHGLDPLTFYVVPLTAIFMFAVLVYLAYHFRFRAATHKRLILIATINIAGAAIGRFPIAALQHTPPLQNLVTLSFLLLIVAYDFISQGRLLKSTLWAGLALMVMQLVRIPIAMTPAWHHFAILMGGHA